VLEKWCKHMASVTAFRDSVVDRPRLSAVSTEAETDEDSSRNRANFFAAVVVVLLIAAGWWLVNSLAETQRVHGCYTSGTRYCSSI
jgi:hypothetical protein